MSCDQREKLSELSGLPEVAREYVLTKRNEMLELQRRSKAPSRREVVEKGAMRRCEMDEIDINQLESVWDDLEYLEYPKRLLMTIPKLLFDPRVIQLATRDTALARSLAEKFRTLQGIAETKTFLFPPLISAVRRAALTEPRTLDILEIGNFIVRIAEHPPEPTIDLMLEEATTCLTPFGYEHHFGEPASYGFAAYLDLVSRLSEHQDLVESTLERLLDRWKAQKEPPRAWKTTLQLQVLLLCFEQYTPISSDQAQGLLEDLFHVVAIEPLPRYRYILEWIIIQISIRHDLQDFLLFRLITKDHHANPKHLASVMKIITILACREGSGEDFAFHLAIAFVPLAASSKVVIRHEAQWQIPVLMDHARTSEWTSITGNPALTALDDYIRSLERFHDPPPERLAGGFNPETDHTLANLVEGKWFDLDHTKARLTSRRELVRLRDADSLQTAASSCMPLGDEIDRPATQQAKAELVEIKTTVGPRTSNEVAALQTKGTAYLARTLSNPSDQQARSSKAIVIGSLVDNPYNLGGLSRVSEIFGASALCLQNQKVLSNKGFTSVAVSSHLHFPVVQLSVPGIPDFLAERKAEGFCVVGIEQTDRSVLLGSEGAKLPERVVLVVGSEKEGIPAIVLTECDMLVEIPQRGITRSLNVQTAASVVLYEHARQHNQTAL